MPLGYRKTLYLDRLNSTNGICIKDEDINSVDEISDNCNSENEFKIECDGTLQGAYRCTYNSSAGKYKIEGLKHSGIQQIEYEAPEKPAASPTATSASASGSSSGGGGGGAGPIICSPVWECSEWSKCSSKISARKCYDVYKCASSKGKPDEIMECKEETFLDKIIDSVTDSREDNQNPDTEKPSEKKVNFITGLVTGRIKISATSSLIVFLSMVVLALSYVYIKKTFFTKSL